MSIGFTSLIFIFTSLTSKSDVFLITCLIFKFADNSLITTFSFTSKFTNTLTLLSWSTSTLDVTSSAPLKPFTTPSTKFSNVSLVINNLPSEFSSKILFLASFFSLELESKNIHLIASNINTTESPNNTFDVTWSDNACLTISVTKFISKNH